VNEKKLEPPTLNRPLNSSVTVTGVVAVVFVDESVVVLGDVGVSPLHATPTITATVTLHTSGLAPLTALVNVTASGQRVYRKNDNRRRFCMPNAR
jgi:hypothetical protein